MKVAIYARVSTAKQEQQETIQSQLEALRDFAKKNGHAIVAEFKDNGYSGELLARPALDRLRDDASKKLFEGILIHSPDRLSRKFIHVGLLEEELNKHSIRTVFLNRPNAGDTPEDNLLSGVQGLIAEYEKAKILERTRRGRLHKARRGEIVVARSTYGFDYIRTDRISRTPGYYRVNDEEARVVRLIFKLFVERGLSIRGIAKELTRRGISPQRGLKWRTSSLHRILRNEIYVGLYHYNKHEACEPDPKNRRNKSPRRKNTSMRLRPRGEWIPIQLPAELHLIARQTFEETQKLLRRNLELSPRHVKHDYLLRGLLACGACGSPYGGESCHEKLYYRCRNRHRTFPEPRDCKAGSVKASRLEEVVWEAISAALKNPRLIVQQVEKLRQEAKKSSSNPDAEIEAIEAAIEKLKVQKDRVLDAYRAEAISLDQLKEQMAKISGKEASLNAEMASLEDAKARINPPAYLTKSVRDNCRHIAKRLEELKGSFEGKRELLLKLVEQIILDGRKVRIQGAIPAQPVPITSTSAWRCEHNPSIRFELVTTLKG